MRRCLLVILALVMAGTTVDLMLLDHHEDRWQMVPLVLNGCGLLCLATCAWVGSPRSIVVLRIVMSLFIGAGFVGIGLHYLGNMEFQKELDATQSGWPLFVKVITAKAPPMLAPAVMAHMGLLGLLYTYQHPALRRSDGPSPLTSSGVSA